MEQCASSDAHRLAATATIKVGLITKTDTNPFFVKMKEGAQKQAKALGVTLLTAAGKIDGDNASQITAIENMVTRRRQGHPDHAERTKAIVPAIKKARAKGVLVIALDTPTEPADAPSTRSSRPTTSPPAC